jgi:hypothetical protein
MNECPWMFLVHIQRGTKPRVSRVDPMEPANLDDHRFVRLSRRRSRAWLTRKGIAAVADSVEEAFKLVEQLVTPPGGN